jgi:hypothetical protein
MRTGPKGDDDAVTEVVGEGPWPAAGKRGQRGGAKRRVDSRPRRQLGSTVDKQGATAWDSVAEDESARKKKSQDLWRL